MKGYGEYKATGLPWLNEVPSHWKIYRGKQLFVSINCRSESGTEELLSVSATHGVVKRKDVNVTMFQASSYQGYKLCWPDDLVINSLWAWQRGLGFSKYHGIISTAYSVFRLKNREASNPRYYNYFMRGSDYIWELYVRSKGIWKSRYQLSDDDFLRSPIISPPREEQDQIVRYLDAKVGKINKLIKIKQQQIALLKEKKQAIINQAVTRGLDPNAPMKDSGIAWIGQIPEGWEITYFSRIITDITQGWSPITGDGDRQEGQWGVLSLSAVNDGEFYSDAVKPIPLNVTVNSDLELRKGDFLLTRSNTRLLVGDVCIVDVGAKKLIPSDLIYKLTTDNIEKRYLLYFMRSFIGRQQIEQSAHGSSGTMPKLTHRHIKSWKILLPPLEEQVRIVRYIFENISAIKLNISHINSFINTLTEYRTRLISDVVTGKVDVRGLAVPDTCEEEEENTMDGHPWLAQEDEDEYSVADMEKQPE